MREHINTPVDIAAAGLSPIVPIQPGNRIAVLEYQLLNVAGAQNIQFLEGTVPLSGVYTGFPAMSALNRLANNRPAWILQPNKAFQITCSAGTQVSGYVLWIPVPSGVNPMEYIYGPERVYLGPLSDMQKSRLVQDLSGGW